MLVERAQPADAAALLGLHRRILAEGEFFITEPDELRDDLASKVETVRSCLRSHTSVILVAREGAAIVGMAQAINGSLRRTRHIARIEMMVDAGWRDRGVGTALLGAVVSWAEANPELAKLSLQVFSHNERAIALYRKFGFVEEGRREREYRFADGSWRGDVLMARGVG